MYAQNTSPLKDQMDEITKQTELKWTYNPFRTTREEKLMVGWQDPYAYVSRFWIGANLSASSMFPNPNYHLDDVFTYITPTIATELSAVAFERNTFKFRMGVGVLIDFSMAIYTQNIPRFGENLMLADFTQVELYFDFIFEEMWKLRWSPIRHRCDHISGDIMGNPYLYDPEELPFADSDYNTMNFQFFYLYSWFIVYGGLEMGIWGMHDSTYATIFSFSIGSDVRIPVWGKMNVILGVYFAGEYERFNTLSKDINDDGSSSETIEVLDSYNKWSPLVSVGIGIEFDRVTYGIKYIRKRSRQLHAHTVFEQRIGAEFTILY